MINSQRDYVLGHDSEELRRLDEQAAVLAPATRTILTLAGIRPGMRVLDVGTGTGEVALIAAELVGPSGSVLGVDRSAPALAYAERKRDACALRQLSFRHADLTEFAPEPGFDAVVGRLVLAYLPDPIQAARTWLRLLRPGGVVVTMEYDIAAARTVPVTPLATQMLQRVMATFEAVGTPMTLGPHLHALLVGAGASDPTVLGLQAYLSPDDRRGPAMIRDIVASLQPAMERAGIASADELDTATLTRRLTSELCAYQAVVCPPALVGAWGYARSAFSAE